MLFRSPPGLRADRYVYYSGIGLFMLAGLGGAALVRKITGPGVFRNVVLMVLTGTIGVAAAWATTIRNRVWESSYTLFTDSLAKNPTNSLAHHNLGAYLKDHDARGVFVREGGQLDLAGEHFTAAITIDPNHADAHGDLASVRIAQKRFAEALPLARRAVELKEGSAINHFIYGNALLGTGRLDQAAEEYAKAVALDRSFTDAYNNLTIALYRLKRHEDLKHALEAFSEADPGNWRAFNNLAWLLATCPQSAVRDGGRALTLARQAGQMPGSDAVDTLSTLAAALAETGRFDEAVATQRQIGRAHV